MPDLSAALLREELLEVSNRLQGERRIMVFTCQDDVAGAKLRSQLNDTGTATVDVICAGQITPVICGLHTQP